MKTMKTADWPIAKADAYGGVLLTRHGQILLREPANHFDGYVWTFAKGKPDEEDTPEQTALREVQEETGYQAEVVDVLPGVFHSGFSGNAYFIMRHLGPPGEPDWETQATRWVDFETAVALIEQTTNAKGRARDLAVLKAARAWFDANLTVVLPDHERDTAIPAKKSNWNVQDMPAQFVTLPLDFTLDAKEAASVRLGFIPSAMEDKWFIYFENNTLFQHRSWTGYCIDQVHFVAEGCGFRATHAEVNRDVEQYEGTDKEDKQRIEAMVRQLGGGVADDDAQPDVEDVELHEYEEALPVKLAVSNFEALLKSLQAISNHRLSPFQFSAIGIMPGTVLTFKLDSAMTCVVAKGNRVQLQGETMSTSKAAVLALQNFGRKVTTARGPDYWTLNGVSLTHLRAK